MKLLAIVILALMLAPFLAMSITQAGSIPDRQITIESVAVAIPPNTDRVILYVDGRLWAEHTALPNQTAVWFHYLDIPANSRIKVEVSP